MPDTISEIKALLGGVAVVLSLVAFIPYIRSILRGQTKPHMFSWIIWGLTTFVIFLAQFSDKGGAGTWSIGLSGAIALFIALLAFLRRSDVSITSLDWCFFIAALAAIPLWYMTDNPLSAVIILTTIDILGFLPTVRKAYHKPFEEALPLYVIVNFRNIISIAALENYSATTLLFPVATTAASLPFIAMVLWRRRALGSQ